MNGNGNGELRPNPVRTLFWQVLGSVSGAAIIGLFFWLWNVTLDIRELQNTRTDMGRITGELAASRSLIDRNSERLIKIEGHVDQDKERWQDFSRMFDSIRSDATKARELVATFSVEFSRMSETLRHVDQNMQRHLSGDREYPSGPPERGLSGSGIRR